MKTTNKYKHAIYLSAFMIPMIIALIGLILGGFAPFGTKDILTASGMEKQLTFYYELYDRIASGKTLSYSIRSGMGSAFSSTAATYLSDPLNLIVLLFPRNIIISVFSIIFAIKVGFSGLFFSLLLMNKKASFISEKEKMEEIRKDEITLIANKASDKKKAEREKAKAKGISEKKDFKLGGSEAPKTKIGTLLSLLDLPILAFSTAYALSGFSFSLGLNPAYLSVAALLPLIILGLELLIREKKWGLYCATNSLSILCSLQLTLTAYVFVFIYFFLYEFDNMHAFVTALLRKAATDILSIGITLAVFLPAVSGGFFGNEITSHFPSPAFYTSFFDTFKKLFTNTPPASTELYGFGMDIYCGFFAVILFILFLVNKNIKRSLRIRYMLLSSVLFFGTTIDSLNHLLNGFHYASYNKIYYSFAFAFLILVIGYIGFLNAEHIRPLHLNLASLGIICLFALTMMFSYNYDSLSPFINAFETLLAVFFILLLYRNNSMTKVFFTVSFSLVILVEVILTFTNAMSVLGKHTVNYYDTLESKYYETEAFLHSSNPSSKIYVYDGTNASNPLLFMLNGSDYIICKEGTPNPGVLLSLRETRNGIDIYENKYALHGLFTEKDPVSFPYYKKNPFLSYNVLSREYLGGEDIFTVNGDFSLAGSGFSYDRNGFAEAHTSEMQINGTVPESGPYYSHLFTDRYLGEISEGEDFLYSFSFPLRDAQGNISMFNSYKFDVDAFLRLYDKQKTFASSYSISGSEDTVTYSVNAPSSGYFILDTDCLPMGSKITLNDSECPVTRLYNDLLIIPVSAGANTISLIYSSVGFAPGLIISVVLLLAVALISIAELRRKKPFALSLDNAVSPISKFISENYVYFSSILITTAVFVISMILTRCTPFGANMLLGGDSYIQDYLGHVNFYNSAKESGLSLLDYSIGICRTNTQTLLGYIFHPLDLIAAFIIPKSLYMVSVILPKYLALVFAGVSLIFYLTNRKVGTRLVKTDARLIAFGVAYSLCNYSIGYFIYNSFQFLLYVPLIILAFERLIYDKKPLLYIFLLGLFMENAYYAFMLCEFLFLYFFTVRFESVKDFFNKGIRFGISSIAAAGLQAVSLLSFYFSTKDSPYKAGDSVLPPVNKLANPLTTLSYFSPFHRPITVIWDSYYVNIYCGLLLFILIPAYAISKNESLSVRIRKFILSAVLFMGFIYAPFNYTFHGFHYQSGVPNRFAAFFIFLLFTFMYDIIVSVESINRIALSLGMLVFSALLAVSWFVTGGIQLLSILSVLILLGYLSFALIYVVKKNTHFFTAAICVLLCIETLISGCNSFYGSIGNRSDDIYALQASLEKLVRNNPELQEDFTVTEFINNSINNYSLLTSSESISNFSSDIRGAQTKLISKWNLLYSGNVIYYGTGNPLADLMLRVKYHVVDIYDEEAASNYRLINTTDNYELYETPHSLPLGILIKNNPNVTAWDEKPISEYDTTFDYQNAFVNALGLPDLYTSVYLEEDNEKISDDVSYCMADTSMLDGSELDGEIEIPIYVKTAKALSGSLYVSSATSMFYIGEASEGTNEELTFSIPISKEHPSFKVSIAVLNKEVLEQLANLLLSNTMVDTKRGSNTISGHVSAPEDGTYFLSLPNYGEWVIFVDGKAIEHETFLGGIGIPVSAGEHDILLRYVPDNIMLGTCITLLTILSLFIYSQVGKKLKKRELQKKSLKTE